MLKRLKSWVEGHKMAVALIATTLFILLSIPILINHEIWADEAVSWGLSKEITPTNIYDINSAEPYPFLWQIILAPFSKAGFPIVTMNIIALILVSIAIFLFFRFAPMELPVKIIFLFSSAFFYYNPVIARNYALIPLAVCFVCLAYKNRAKKSFLYGLSLAFLAQTHFLMIGFLSALLVGFIVERIYSEDNAKLTMKKIIFFSMPLIVSIISIIPIIINALTNNAILNGEVYKQSANYRSIFPVFENSIFGVDIMIINVIGVVLFIILFLALIVENIKVAFYLTASLGFWFYVFTVLCPSYSNFTQKCSIIFLIMFALTWILYEDDGKKCKGIIFKLFGFSEIVKYLREKLKYPSIVIICIFFAATIPNTIVRAINDVNRPYSNSTEISEFINNMEGKTIVIIADVYSYENVFSPDVRAKINNDEVTIYNMPLDSYDNYGLPLRYDSAAYNAFRKIKVLTSDKILELFDNFSKDYEHIYYITVTYRMSCDNELYIQEYLSRDQFVQELNTSDYVDGVYIPVTVYKIK